LNLERELKRFVRQIRPGLIGATSNPNANLNQLIEEVKTASSLRTELGAQLEEFLGSRDFVTALTETGLTFESGVFSEILKRLEYKLLPKPVQSADVLTFLTRIFDTQSDASWLERINRQRFGELLGLLLPDREKMIESLGPQIFLSLEVLSLRLAGLGYDPIVTNRLRMRRELQSSFMDVTRHVHGLLDGKGEAALPDIRESLNRCLAAVEWIHSRRSEDGVSLELTYKIMRIEEIVWRMDLVLKLTQAILVKWESEPALTLFFEIMMTEIRRFNLWQFLSDNVSMLAYQITEHTGKAGEHYITRSRREWVDLFISAAIGGIVVGVCAVLKFYISYLGLPIMPQALAYSLLYSAGFLFILYLGGTIATKQPAMTASTLAASMDAAATSEEAMENLAEIIVRTIRSQLVAVLGNYLLAAPTAAFVCLPFNLFHIPVMDHAKAWHTLEGFHALKSLSLWYGAIAGIGLFATGLLGGIADNWFVFNNVGERLKHAEALRRWVNPHNLGRVIKSIDNNLGFWVSNVSLGFWLGSMSAVGAMFGLPLDTRHISFSSGQFGVAMANLNFSVPSSIVIISVISIFCVGLVNLGVSFSLSLFVATRSRKIRFSQTPQLMSLLLKRLLTHPTDFFFPPRDAV